MRRQFQEDMLQITTDIIEEVNLDRVFYGAITPGGGKSSLPLVLTRLLPTLAEKICWVVPRVTLGKQAEQVFVNKRMQHLFPHTRSMRYATNSYDPSRGTDGYITTYQAVAAEPKLHQYEFERHRYILFLDEPHHVKTHFTQPEHPDFAWAHAIQPLIDRARLVFYASGTFARHDEKPILGIPYVMTPEGYKIDFPDKQLLSYSRTQALKEKAIVPLQFIVRDGKAMWRDHNGQTVERGSFDETSYESGAMLESVLETNFARELLADTVKHWLEHRQRVFIGKLLVVAPNIGLARRYLDWLRKDHALKAEMATSDDSAKALGTIDAYRGRQTPALDAVVTVGMAYEGLDVPAITHIACLTRYRSRPWLEQCFARACRTMPGKHTGYVFAPDDPLLNEVIKVIYQEQHDAIAKDPAAPEPGPDSTGPEERTGEGALTTAILPLSSSATDMRNYDLENSLSREETAHLAGVMRDHGIGGISALQFKKAIEAAQEAPSPRTAGWHEDQGLTPSEMEERLRYKIHEYTKEVDAQYFALAWGTANAEIRKAGFGMREEMAVADLLQLWDWLPTRFPLTREMS